MSELKAAAFPAITPAPRWLRIVLIVAAAIELLEGVRDFPILFGDLSEIPGPGLGGWIITGKIALHPVVAGAALIFVSFGRLHHALVAMAALIFLTWLNDLPSVFIHGLDLKGDGVGGLNTVFQILLAPLLAATVVALVVFNQRLGLATLLAVLPTVIGVLGVVAFAIAISIYGF